jgi:hypothetical protein
MGPVPAALCICTPPPQHTHQARRSPSSREQEGCWFGSRNPLSSVACPARTRSVRHRSPSSPDLPTPPHHPCVRIPARASARSRLPRPSQDSAEDPGPSRRGRAERGLKLARGPPPLVIPSARGVSAPLLSRRAPRPGRTGTPHRVPRLPTLHPARPGTRPARAQRPLWPRQAPAAAGEEAAVRRTAPTPSPPSPRVAGGVRASAPAPDFLRAAAAAAATAAPRARGYLFISGPRSAYNGAAVSRSFYCCCCCRRRRRPSFFSRQIFVVWEGSRDGLELADRLLEPPRLERAPQPRGGAATTAAAPRPRRTRPPSVSPSARPHPRSPVASLQSPLAAADVCGVSPRRGLW